MIGRLGCANIDDRSRNGGPRVVNGILESSQGVVLRINSNVGIRTPDSKRQRSGSNLRRITGL